LRLTGERLLRLTIHTGEGYTSLTLTDQDVEDYVTLTKEDLTSGKQKPTWRIIKFCIGKSRGQ
jgi:hypothetical protein